MDPSHLLHESMIGTTSVQGERQRSRHPIVPATRKLLGILQILVIRVRMETNCYINL